MTLFELQLTKRVVKALRQAEMDRHVHGSLLGESFRNIKRLHKDLTALQLRVKVLERDVKYTVCPECGLHVERGKDHNCSSPIAEGMRAVGSCSRCKDVAVKPDMPPCDKCRRCQGEGHEDLFTPGVKS